MFHCDFKLQLLLSNGFVNYRRRVENQKQNNYSKLNSVAVNGVIQLKLYLSFYFMLRYEMCLIEISIGFAENQFIVTLVYS